MRKINKKKRKKRKKKNTKMACSSFSNLKPGLIYYFGGNYFTHFYRVKLVQKFNLFRRKMKVLFYI